MTSKKPNKSNPNKITKNITIIISIFNANLISFQIKRTAITTIKNTSHNGIPYPNRVIPNIPIPFNQVGNSYMPYNVF